MYDGSAIVSMHGTYIQAVATSMAQIIQSYAILLALSSANTTKNK